MASRAEWISSFSVTSTPSPARRRRQSSTNGSQQVHAGVAAKRARRTLGADRDDGLVLKGQVEEVSHFLQRSPCREE